MPRKLPREVYRIVPALYPHFAEILNSVGLTGLEFLCLSYVRNAGRPVDDGSIGLPLAALKAMLVTIGHYETENGALGFITNHLQTKKEYLRHYRFTSAKEKEERFPDAGGYRDAVVLTPEGVKKLDELNDRVDKLYAKVTATISGKALAVVLKGLLPLAKQLTKELEKLTAEQTRV